LVSAADQGNACADHCAEKEGSFHYYWFVARRPAGCV
jgi:hypothetical protein